MVLGFMEGISKMIIKKFLLVTLIVCGFVNQAQAGLLDFFHVSCEKASDLVRGHPYTASGIALAAFIAAIPALYQSFRDFWAIRRFKQDNKQAIEEAIRFGVNPYAYMNAGCNVDRM